MSNDVIVFEKFPAPNGFETAVATLNSEKTLNSLSAAMIEGLGPQLDVWAHDPKVAIVVLQGAGEKAFCAGGDIRALYDAMKDHPIGQPVPEANKFFKLEYALDEKIHTYPKPILCIGHGIVMGGGLGLMAGASHRIVSERSLIAMPEITIGLYPDVGASWFLNRMPGRTGLYLGLTGTRLNAADALYVKLADHFVPRAHHAALLDSVKNARWSSESRENHAILSKICRDAHHLAQASLPVSPLRAHYDFVQEITDADSVHEIFEKFSKLQIEDPWVLAGKKSFLAGSPTSAGVIFDQLAFTKHLSLSQCFEFEYRLSSSFAKHPDFREGIRALIVDKDNAPRWSPGHVAELRRGDIHKLLSD
ncbi:MAG: enoyl-CoA hydratase/isomerase family protein [Bdellovibrionota bacterium]